MTMPFTCGSTGRQFLIPTPLKGDQGEEGTSFNVQYPASQSVTLGTAFQPRPSGACALNVIASLSGSLNLTDVVNVAVCATEGGSYVTVATIVLFIGILTLAADTRNALVMVPTGGWVKISRTGSSATVTAFRTDL